MVYRKVMSRFLSILSLTLVLLSHCAGAFASANLNNAKGEGFIDTITLTDNRVNVQGWAAPEQANQQITAIKIMFDNTSVYQGSFARLQRPDVANAYARPQWSASGWRVSSEIPDEFSPGVYSVTAQAQTSAGEWIQLTASQAAKQISISSNAREEKLLIRNVKIVIACALLFLAVCFIQARPLTLFINTRFRLNLSEPVVFSGCVLLVASLFVSLGLTGSSLGLGQPNAPFVQMNSTQIMGQNRAVRSDEWLVITPLAIAQYNHSPSNPILNKNLGEDGQNMLVIGMTGAPVTHVSEIAKPATWGFFVFDLRRALSWNWCFSLVSCFLGLAFVLNRLGAEHWKHGFLFSALFCYAPYVAAWSNWPAYAVFFPCLIFLCTLQILKAIRAYQLIFLAGLLGLALAGFVFILYPPWQVSIGYVFIAVTIGVMVREKLYRALTFRRITAYVFALCLTGIIVTLWWLDAKSAVQLMEQTVYPGQRISAGGTVTLSSLLRGFTNISTLQQLNSPFSNQSEIASFYYLLVPLAVLFVVRLLQKTVTALEWSLALIITFIMFYMFVGLPLEWARYSLWGRVPAHRADVALGLACLMLTHLLFTRRHQPANASSLTKSLGLAAALAWMYIVYRSMRQWDESVLSGLNNSIIIALLLVTGAISYCMIANKFKPFMYMSLGLSLATTASFNPINIAPQTINVQPLKSRSPELATLIGNHRVLVLENTITAMLLLSSGISVANGIFYYPQKSLWSRLDPAGSETDTYNRYQHLIYRGSDSLVEDYILGTPQADVVTVSINLRTFDFRKSGAQIITAPDADKNALNNNPTLALLLSDGGWSWYKIKSL